jgi:hypothetical protein
MKLEPFFKCWVGKNIFSRNITITEYNHFYICCKNIKICDSEHNVNEANMMQFIKLYEKLIINNEILHMDWQIVIVENGELNYAEYSLLIKDIYLKDFDIKESVNCFCMNEHICFNGFGLEELINNIHKANKKTFVIYNTEKNYYKFFNSYSLKKIKDKLIENEKVVLVSKDKNYFNNMKILKKYSQKSFTLNENDFGFNLESDDILDIIKDFDLVSIK